MSELMSPHFPLSVFTKSQTALRKSIANDPPDIAKKALKVLCETILEPIFERFQTVPHVNSGYRSVALNREVGGQPNSRHLFGEAVDIEIPGVSNPDLANAIVEMGLPFDELILEFYSQGRPDSGWVHVQHGTKNRGKVLTAIRRNGAVAYLPGIQA